MGLLRGRGHGGLRTGQRGSIAQVLFFMLLVLSMLVVSAVGTLFQMRLNRQDQAEDGARRLAEAAIQVTIARILKNPDLAPADLPVVELPLASYPDGQGLLALDPGAASALSIPFSVNNLKGGGAVAGWGSTVVAQQTASLVGVGRYMGRESKVEVVLHLPRFPYVVSSTVPIEAIDGLQVFGVNDPSALSMGFGAIPPELREPGHIVTNSEDQGAAALQLNGAATLVEGDAQSRGTVSVGGGARVLGEQRPQADLAPIPAVDVAGLDTASRPGVNVIAPGAYGATTLSGFNRSTGNLAIAGGATLDGGILYVDGSVSIDGGLTGNGAIIASGSVQVRGGGALTGANGAAILSQGGITLQGTPSQRSEFRGLLYSEGNLDALDANIAGAVVVNNPDPSGSVQLEQVTLAESQQLAVISIPVLTTLPGTPAGMVAGPATLHANLPDVNPPSYDAGPRNQYLTDGSGPYPVRFTANMNGPRPDYTTPPPGYTVTHQPTPDEPYYQIGPPDPMPADLVTLGSIRINNLNPDGPADSYDADSGLAWQNAHSPDYTDSASARAALIDAATAWGDSNPAQHTDDFLAAAANHTLSTMDEFIDSWNSNAQLLATVDGNTEYVPGSDPITILTIWQLDLSQFYNLAEGIRILSWRQI
jgi:hypothetical protein